jgi:hypothetical protein
MSVTVKDGVTSFLVKIDDKEMKKALKGASRKIVSVGVRTVKTEYRKTGIKHRPHLQYKKNARTVEKKHEQLLFYPINGKFNLLKINFI